MLLFVVIVVFLEKSIFLSTHCSILGMTTILIDDGHHHAIAMKLTLAQMCVSSIRSDFNICLSLLASSSSFFTRNPFFRVCVSSELH